MKKFRLLFTATVLSLLAHGVKAQERPQLSEVQKQEMMAQFQQNKERLALAPEQETPFKEITKKYASELKAVKNSSDDRREKFRKIQDIRDRKNAEMKGILSEKQYQTYLEIQQERVRKMKEKRNDK